MTNLNPLGIMVTLCTTPATWFVLKTDPYSCFFRSSDKTSSTERGVRLRVCVSVDRYQRERTRATIHRREVGLVSPFISPRRGQQKDEVFSGFSVVLSRSPERPILSSEPIKKPSDLTVTPCHKIKMRNSEARRGVPTRSLGWMAAIGLALWYISLPLDDAASHRVTMTALTEERKQKLYRNAFKIHHVDGTVHNSTMMPKGLRLVLLGDSQMRFQYLSLAYFLRHQKFFDPNQLEGHLTNEYTGFDGWGDFYSVTNGWLHPFEHCDCFRSNPFYVSSVENRYFFDPHNDNMVIYLQAFGHSSPMFGRWSIDEINHKIRHETPPKPLPQLNATVDDMVCNENNWHTVVRDYVAKYDPKPTHFVANAGLWRNRFVKDPQEHRALVQSVKDAGMVGIWKTTTYRRNHTLFRFRASDGVEMLQNDEDFCRDFDLCLNVSWTQHLDARNFWDTIHFWEPINRAMNEDLLELLGYTFPPGYRKVPKEDYYMLNSMTPGSKVPKIKA